MTGIIVGVRVFVDMIGNAVVLEAVDGGNGSGGATFPDHICRIPGEGSASIGSVGIDLADIGILKALPMSLRVSLRARSFMFGATAGM